MEEDVKEKLLENVRYRVRIKVSDSLEDRTFLEVINSIFRREYRLSNENDIRPAVIAYRRDKIKFQQKDVRGEKARIYTLSGSLESKKRIDFFVSKAEEEYRQIKKQEPEIIQIFNSAVEKPWAKQN